MTETVTIAALGHEGDGVADAPAGRVFVPFALPGESVTIDRLGERGSLLSILAPSADRIAPICRHFGACGGCALQHLAGPAYRAWKEQQVANAFAQRGIAVDVKPIISIGPGARRRTSFTATRDRAGVILGFSRRASNEILPIHECPVLTAAIVSRLPALTRMAGILLTPNRPLRLAVLSADNGLDVAAEGARRPGRSELEALARFALEPGFARLTVDGETVFATRPPEISADDATLLPPPGGFLQAAGTAEAALANAVEAAVGSGGPIADLFSGIGTFTLRLARRRPVLAVEGDAAALAALDQASRKARGRKPITTRQRDLFRNPLAPVELNAFAAVVFDPPRAGAKAQAEQLAASSVRHVVAVSCNPATLARDARILVDGGYRITSVQPVDQFLFSPHIEVVAAFER